LRGAAGEQARPGRMRGRGAGAAGEQARPGRMPTLADDNVGGPPTITLMRLTGTISCCP
jgi:hypothetical protein